MDPATQVSNSGINYGNGSTGCGISTITNNNTQTINNTILAQQPDKAECEILKWISPLELPDRHHSVRELRFPGVGNWILGTPEFKGWEDGSAHPILFCDGDPGVGKTFIRYKRRSSGQSVYIANQQNFSSLVIDALRSQARERKFHVFYLYCDYPTFKGRLAVDLMARLLKQALAGLGRIPESVGRKFEGSEVPGSDRMRPLLPDVVDMLATVLASFERVFVCIDALDEFPPLQWPDLLRSLAELTRLSETRLFLTGRPQIQCDKYLGEDAQTISITTRDGEIEAYIAYRLDQDQNSDEMNTELKTEIMKTLPHKVSGMYVGVYLMPETCHSLTVMPRFLLVYLKMNAILAAVTIHKRRERLRAMEDSPKLWDEYDKTLRRIAEQDTAKSELALNVLMWLYYSKRPLCADELRHALAVEKGSTKLNSDNVSSTQTLLGCCLGLVTVDKKASTVRFIHTTLKDYLHNEHERFQGTNLTIAETCLTYLNTEDIKSLSPSLCIAPTENPFLQYASYYWGEHAREETTDHAISLAKNLLGRYDEHISAKLLLFEKSWPWWYDPECHSGFSGLHCAAFFGLQEMAIAFPNSSEKDITGSTPLTWAAKNGHEEFVRFLLKRKDISDLKTQDNDGCTPFSWAARNGHTGVAALLLQEDAVDPEMEDRFGRTPLSWASGNGHQGVVESLLERGASPETKDCHGRTPLSWASGGGHRDVVKLLLRTGKAGPNSPDNEGRTPVSWAAEAAHKEVVDLLLCGHGVGPNFPDHNRRTLPSRTAGSGNSLVVKLSLDQVGIVSNMADKAGITPLSWAASKGNEAVVELFMKKREIGAGLLYEDGSISLWWAAGSGHAGVVRILLGWEGVDPNFLGGYGQTPLVRAAMHGHEQVVALLLESKRVNHNLADSSGRTPLSWAAGSWRDKVVELLLGGGGIDTELADKNGRTPLLWAARNGSERVVQLLLEGNAKPDSRDIDGRTPASWAADEGHEQVVALLLGRPSVNPNSADGTGRTPLSWAAGNGREAAAKLLLTQSGIKPNVVDGVGRTPLSWAAGNGREAVAKLLLNQGDIKLNAVDGVGRTPLSWAAGNGWEAVTELLLSRNDIEPNIADGVGRTPLSWAAGNGWEVATRLLLSRSDIEPDMADSTGQTPLSWATRNGCDEVVQLLIDHPDADPDSTDDGNRTPLSRAAEEGHEEIISLLLGMSKVNPDSTDRDGRTPLFWAAYRGHEKTVQLLLQQDGVNPHSVDKYGRTPLSWAHENQHQGVVQLFQLHKPVPTIPSPSGPIPPPRSRAFNTQIPRAFSAVYRRVF